jgi:hypothetical protein
MKFVKKIVKKFVNVIKKFTDIRGLSSMDFIKILAPQGVFD